MAATTRATSDTTRGLLLRAAEQLFADQGVDGARTRDITARAGQANSSALHYHFGSREGLLQEILLRHRGRVEGALRPVDATDLTAVVTSYIEAEASELGHASGRDCLRIVSQLAHETGFRDGHPHDALAGTALWGLFTTVAGLVRDRGIPAPLANERVELMVMLVGAAFADRARHVQAGRSRPVGGEAFRADLVRVVVAMLTTPGP
jgi:AcrR family transcriptional regulator